MTAKPRRTPSQIAADELNAARERTAQARARVGNAEAELAKAKEALVRAERMEGYARQHPDLPAEPESDDTAREKP